MPKPRMVLRQYDGDWEPAEMPENIALDPTAYLHSVESFGLCRGEFDPAVSVGRGSQVNYGTAFDVGQQGRILIGNYVLLTAVMFQCDASITVGDYTMISWSAVIMDTYRWPRNFEEREKELTQLTERFERRPAVVVPAQPVVIGENVWIGFEAVILPGVTIGNDSIVGARSVVATNVPPGVVVAGNPARVVKSLRKKDQK